jgi:hypothetical protein
MMGMKQEGRGGRRRAAAATQAEVVAAPVRGAKSMSIIAHPVKSIASGGVPDVTLSTEPLRRAQEVLADPRVQRRVRELSASDRTPVVRKLRAEMFAFLSALYVRVLAESFRITDANVLLRRIQERQMAVGVGVAFLPAPTAVEELLIRFSDLLAELKDPGQSAARKHRRRGIVRRAFSAMPLVRQSFARTQDTFRFRDPDAVTWVVVADVDTLEWLEEPYMDASYEDEAEEPHTVFAPAPDARGNVSIRSFCLWQGIPRATEYAIRERVARSRSGARRIKEDPDIPGLHELPGGGLVVTLEVYLKVMVERRTVCWSRSAEALRRSAATMDALVNTPPVVALEARSSSEDREALLDAPELRVSEPSQVTPTEELLQHLVSLGVHDIEQQRAELLPKIEEERKAMHFVQAHMRMRID